MDRLKIVLHKHKLSLVVVFTQAYWFQLVHRTFELSEGPSGQRLALNEDVVAQGETVEQLLDNFEKGEHAADCRICNGDGETLEDGPNGPEYYACSICEGHGKVAVQGIKHFEG